MDLRPNEEQDALTELVHRVLREHATADRLRAVEASDMRFDGELWTVLAELGIVGACLGSDVGGGGLGILEACLIAEQIGRTAAAVPYYPTVFLGALAVDRFGSPAQRRAFLPAVAAGNLFLSAGLAEDPRGGLPGAATTTAVRRGNSWHLSGEKWFVPIAPQAERILVPASVDGDTGVFLVDPRSTGATITALQTTSGEPEYRLQLQDVVVADEDVLGALDQGEEIVTWITRRAIAGLCALQAGVCAEALHLTARHTSEREQFGAKIATFQAVAQRSADAYIDTAAVTLTARQAAWRLANDLPSDLELSIAKFWAADGGQRVAHAAQHLHGGIGVDTDYPLHRYFRRAKQIELTLGGAHEHLARIGDVLASGAER